MAIRYAATSTAAGSGGSGSGACTATRSASSRVDSRSANAVSAGEQAQLVERRRAEVLHDAAYLAHAAQRLVLQVREQRVGGARVGAQHVARGVHPQRHAGQRRAEAVVQVAAQPPTFLLPAHDQAFTGPPQGTVQQDGMRGDGHLTGRGRPAAAARPA